MFLPCLLLFLANTQQQSIPINQSEPQYFLQLSPLSGIGPATNSLILQRQFKSPCPAATFRYFHNIPSVFLRR